jgi:hypothetical protein
MIQSSNKLYIVLMYLWRNELINRSVQFNSDAVVKDELTNMSVHSIKIVTNELTNGSVQIVQNDNRWTYKQISSICTDNRWTYKQISSNCTEW